MDVIPLHIISEGEKTWSIPLQSCVGLTTVCPIELSSVPQKQFVAITEVME
jgi:hypothetical protein